MGKGNQKQKSKTESGVETYVSSLRGLLRRSLSKVSNQNDRDGGKMERGDMSHMTEARWRESKHTVSLSRPWRSTRYKGINIPPLFLSVASSEKRFCLA